MPTPETIIQFTVEAKGQPQGSSSGFVVGGHVNITSANKKLKPFRAQVSAEAYEACYRKGHDVPEQGAVFGKHIPVVLIIHFEFVRPSSVRNRPQMIVKPDLDKLIRGVCDALTGIVYLDDAQVVVITATKKYSERDCVHISAYALK